jgi:tetratricopeptide (TPR) repeat protein
MARLSTAVVLFLSATLLCGCGSKPRPRAARASPVHVERPNADAARFNLRGCKLRDVKEYDSAMYYFRTALELGREHQLGMRMAAAYQNIGTIYSDRAFDFREYNHEADLESAAACYDTAMRILSDSGEHSRAVSLLTDMAVAYFRDPKYQKRADGLFQKARTQAQKHGLVVDEGMILYHQAQLHADQAVEAKSLRGLRAAAALLDTAVILLRQADDKQLAGSAEVMAEDWHEAIRELESREGR